MKIERDVPFGKLVQERRVELGLSMRKFAEKIGIGVAYQSDIEYGTRAVPENDVLDKIIAAMQLTPEEECLVYDMAAEQRGGRAIPQDIPNYIRENPYVVCALRSAKGAGAEEADWQRFTEEMNQKRAKKTDG